MSAEPKCVAETLAWCNKRRAVDGKKPLARLPRGYREDGNSCPCGLASGVWVGTAQFRIYDPRDGYYYLDTPESVQRFVAAFDGGKLPQYEASA